MPSLGGEFARIDNRHKLLPLDVDLRIFALLMCSDEDVIPTEAVISRTILISRIRSGNWMRLLGVLMRKGLIDVPPGEVVRQSRGWEVPLSFAISAKGKRVLLAYRDYLMYLLGCFSSTKTTSSNDSSIGKSETSSSASEAS